MILDTPSSSQFLISNLSVDGSRNMGATSGQRTAGYSGTGAGNNIGSNTGTTGGISHSTNAGPHDSNLANKVSNTFYEAPQHLNHPSH